MSDIAVFDSPPPTTVTRDSALHLMNGRLFAMERTYGPSGLSMIRHIDVTDEVASALAKATPALALLASLLRALTERTDDHA